jgi:hypothetical protein
MYDLNTRNVLIVSIACFLAVVAIVIGAVIGNDHADKRHTQMLQACVTAGHIWVRGDCILNVGQVSR